MNKGIDLEREKREQSEQDWVFGAESLSCLAEIPEDVREHYLPKGERQNIGSEKMDCSSRASCNILETKLNWLYTSGKLKNAKWLEQNGYITVNGIELSDRFVAINSGTTPQGNSLKAPLEAIRKFGVIPKAMFPQVESFSEYYNPDSITPEMKALGLEFASIFTINYEKVEEKNYEILLSKDLLDVAGFAWNSPINGEYQATNESPNHAFVIWKTPRYYAYDNYEEGPEDFIKKLSPNYNFYDYGYRLFISAESDIIKKKLDLLQRLLDLMKQVLGLDLKILEKKNMPTPIEPKPELKPEPEKPLYEWDTPAKARHSSRVVMDLYGLSWANKDLLCQVLNCESGFNVKAIHINTDGSRDIGIAQICNKFWIGEDKYFKSEEEVLAYPEKSIHFLCKMFLGGKLKLWVCYSKGLYQKYDSVV